MKGAVAKYLGDVAKGFDDKGKKLLKDSLTARQFNKFESLNALFITGVLESEGKNLWIGADGARVKSLYEVILFTLVFWFFEFNFCQSNKISPQKGDKYQKGKDIFEVVDPDYTDTNDTNCRRVKLKSLNCSSLIRKPSLESLNEEYTPLITNANVKTREDFEPVRSLLTGITGQKEYFPFSTRYAIIATKKDFDNCFKKTSNKAYPYVYISSAGKCSRNLKDFRYDLFYVTHHYEHIQEHILDKNISLDIVVFLDKTIDTQIQNEINQGIVKRVIAVGQERPNINSLLGWEWTPPEFQCLQVQDAEPGKQSCVWIEHEALQSAKDEFVSVLRSVEEQNQISIEHRLLPYIGYCYALVPPSENSRLANQVENLRESFGRKSSLVLREVFSDFGGDSTTDCKRIIVAFDKIIDQIKYANNKKSKAIECLGPTHLLIPKRQTKYIWKNDIKNIGLDQTKVITEADLAMLQPGSHITVLELRNYTEFKSYTGQSHDFHWLLYPDESKKFEQFRIKCSNELIKELRSSERKDLSGITFPVEEQTESPDELLDRICGQDETTAPPPGQPVWQDAISKRISFKSPPSLFHEDGNEEILILPASKSVILVSGQNDQEKFRVAELRVGDQIRIYRNEHENVLFDIADQADDTGRFTQILEDSAFWKERLTEYLDGEIPGDFGLGIKRRVLLHRKPDEKNEDFGVMNRTVLGWENPGSTTKFPQRNKVLKLLLPADRSDQTIRNKRYYNSIMIALGRDLSDEITDYILYQKTGPLLNQFDAPTVKALSIHNMPIRTIAGIETVIEHEEDDTGAD